SLALLIEPANSWKWLVRALLVAGISHPVIIVSRLFYRCLEELMLWLKRPEEAAETAERVLLYGAGFRGQMFLKDRAVKIAKVPDGRQILGFLDDDKSLHYQWVYGFLVLGGLKQLPHLIEQKRIDRVIIVSDLLPESRADIERLTARCGVRLSEWRPGERDVDLPVAESVRPILATEPIEKHA
ncbi:MAG TPA: hypothetical protein VFF11_13220, partial [Candidatus Binatia bacterium]|nr:hypothetical protein [Candidatus Binatia bacterium]